MNFGTPLVIATLTMLITACLDSTPPRDASGRSAATVAMAERLDSVARHAEAEAFEYVSSARVKRLRARRVPPDLQSQASHRFEFADELLRAGSSVEARDTLLGLHRRLAEEPGVPPEFLGAIEELLGLAYLRIAEQENCVLDPGSGMCLLPISLDALHQKQEGSRGAIEWYTRVLERNPDDLGSRWLLNVAAMTVGEHPRGLPERWVIPPSAFEADTTIPPFPEIAKTAGIATMGLAGGGVADDFDNDGDIDVFATSWGLRDQARLYLNDGGARFTERTTEAGLGGIVGGLNAMQTDIDGDGWLDLFVLRGAWMPAGQPNSLLRNRGDGTFEDVTEAAGLLDARSSQTAVWADFDNDGDLDAFVGNEASYGRSHSAQLFINDGGGRFTDRADGSGADVRGFTKGVGAGDIDNDGWVDLYISQLGAPNVLLRNLGVGPNGDLSFADVTARAGVSEPIESFPTAFFDADNDGWIDLFVSGYRTTAADLAADYLGLPNEAVTPRMYRNRGDGTFEDVTVAMHLDIPALTMGMNHGDLDNDGWLDLYLGTGDPDYRSVMPNRMLRNSGGTRFQDVTSAGGFGHIQKGHGVAFADLDADGDQDVFAVMGGAFEGDGFHDALFQNPGFGHHWVTLRLRGVEANRPAIGARVRVTSRGPDGTATTVHRTVGRGGSFGASPLQLQVGLGDAAGPIDIEVDWPGSSHTSRYLSVGIDRAYVIVEGADRPEPAPSFERQGTAGRD